MTIFNYCSECRLVVKESKIFDTKCWWFFQCDTFYLQLERRYSLLSNEKEILAQEVVKLQDCIEDLRRQNSRNEKPEGDMHPRLSSFDPNNPNALQRKIGMHTCTNVYTCIAKTKT